MGLFKKHYTVADAAKDFIAVFEGIKNEQEKIEENQQAIADKALEEAAEARQEKEQAAEAVKNLNELFAIK